MEAAIEMERLSDLARIETELLSTLFAVAVLWQLLRGTINLAGMLQDKPGPPTRNPDPGRVQLLVLSLLVALFTLLGIDEMRAAHEVLLPSQALVYLFVGSHGVYLLDKYRHLKP